jgi:hypothetical protein
VSSVHKTQTTWVVMSALHSCSGALLRIAPGIGYKSPTSPQEPHPSGLDGPKAVLLLSGTQQIGTNEPFQAPHPEKGSAQGRERGTYCSVCRRFVARRHMRYAGESKQIFALNTPRCRGGSGSINPGARLEYGRRALPPLFFHTPDAKQPSPRPITRQKCVPPTGASWNTSGRAERTAGALESI